MSADCCCPDEESENQPEKVSVTRIARSFDREAGNLSADDNSLPGPSPISLRLLGMLDDVAEVRPTLLDLGCGTGLAAIRLAQEGARYVTGIDLSSASIEVALRRAANADLDQTRVRFEVADAASAPLGKHDWVMLDRVICCYDDAERLLANALGAAGSRVAFAVPESRGWRGIVNTLGWGAENLWNAVFHRNSWCSGHVHDVNAIERGLQESGFRPSRHSRRRLWYAAVFDRSTALDPEPSGPSRAHEFDQFPFSPT